MKKFFVLFCSAVLALSLVACNVNSGSSVNPDNSVDKPTTPEEPTTPDVPETPAQPETPVIPQKELCDVCGVEHYKTDKYHFDTRDDIFDWSDEKVKEWYNPFGKCEDITQGGPGSTSFSISIRNDTPTGFGNQGITAYYTKEQYKNVDTMIIPRMYKGYPILGFCSVRVYPDLSALEREDPNEKRKDIRKLYIHKNVNYGRYNIASWSTSVDDMNLYFEGTVEDFQKVVGTVCNTPGISGNLYTLLDGKITPWSYHQVGDYIYHKNYTY